MKIITSLQNQLIKKIASLHKQKNRYLHRLCIAEGIRTCTMFLSSNIELVHLFVTSQYEKIALQIVSKEKIIIVSDSVMKRISEQKNPSGMLGVFTFLQPTIAQCDLYKNTVIFADVTNPGNMGTLIRTASAFNFTQIFCIEGVDPWNAKVIQASAGTIAHTTIVRCSWQTLLEYTKEVPLTALVSKNGTSIKNITKKHCLLVIGNEANGIKKEWLKTCKEHVTIEMPGTSESLNASIAGSIAMYTLTQLHV